MQKDMDLEAASVGLFTVAAATCLAACYFGLGGAVSPLLSAACTATGITATGLDIASSITIEKEAEVYENVLLGESIATSVTGGVGSATAFVATGFAFKKDPSFGEKFTHAIKTGSNKVKGYLNMKKPAENVAEGTDLPDNPPTEDTAEPTKNAEPTTEKPKADTRDKALICGSAFLLAATSAIKGAAFAKLKDSKKASCAIIRKLKDYGSFKPNNPGSTPPPGEATGGSLDIAAGSTSKTGSDRNQEKDAQDNPLPNPPSLAAMAANTPLSNNLDPLRNLAEEQKAPIAAATSALQNGASPTSALHTAIPDLPKEVDQALNTMHQMAKDGILTMEKNPANFQGNDKKNLSAESSDSTFNRSFTPKTGPASTKTLSFLNKNITKKPSSTDIWHTHEKITIFAIVSQRLESSQDKVETLPWVSPLNKALQMKLLDQKK
jgi:hypothetical protein